ncbi:MAG TPA: indolepyruvate oxidoreductase subunit beta [Candidatus Aphodoplasma excrementigallinarum]|uniref:Indolepyruvate ferredoxin oxidoreductase subunit beta n=1 Tax=Candidatus Aphodoplasma excrementigallinarum TaxID=2840673 RepID=A0A9D1T043_9FIRM|nr:indolepyruvate oxidoreductase subunit beta [Candidatus Aphodoplasma excrementigallinarum]
MREGKSVMIVGVGGQGTLLASRILGNVVIEEGYDVKVSEVHGMAQRGGSVVTYVKYGEKVYAPIISEGEADIILSFEELEAYRYLPYLKKGGTLIVNAQEIDPMPVITGAAKYPADIIQKLKDKADGVIAIDALALANEAGNSKAVNVVLLGVLAKSSGIAEEKWLEAVRKTVPPKFLDVNVKAFALGYHA